MKLYVFDIFYYSFFLISQWDERLPIERVSPVSAPIFELSSSCVKLLKPEFVFPLLTYLLFFDLSTELFISFISFIRFPIFYSSMSFVVFFRSNFPEMGLYSLFGVYLLNFLTFSLETLVSLMCLASNFDTPKLTQLFCLQ